LVVPDRRPRTIRTYEDLDMNRLQTLLLTMVVTGWAGETLTAAEQEKNYSLPVLVVSDESTSGACVRLNLQFARQATSQTPLSIAVIEDTPGGAGESIRGSLWLSAMVAALDRRDNLSGVRLTLELSGEIDGPSAGATLCLAVLSALDGRPFPADCAVTGTIMPDGTIGGVGALAEKIKAAAKAGIRRVFIPSYVRFEQDASTGQEVDLRRLGEGLSIELSPVQNITQAYSLLHKEPLAAKPAPPRDVLQLPAVTEEVLKDRFQEHRRVGNELWNALPPADRDQITSNPALKRMFIDEATNAERAYRTGRLLTAVTSMWARRMALQTRKATIESFNLLKPEDFKRQDAAGVIEPLDRIYRRTLADIPELMTLLARRPAGESEVSAQLWADYYGFYGFLGFNDVLQQAIDAVVIELAKPETTAEEKKEYAQSLVELKLLQMFSARWLQEGCGTWPAEVEGLVGTLPRRAVTDSAAAVERLFYSAHLAVDNSFEHDVVRVAAAEAKISHDQALSSLAANDVTLAMHHRSTAAARRLHDALPSLGDPARRRFATAVSTHVQAECLAISSGLMTKWNQLDAEITEEGAFRYGRTDLLNHLMTFARENALEAIDECRRREIPCLQPIAYVESGDLSRDDIETDKVDVLTAYWSASLQAKVLLMLCGDTKNEPPLPANPVIKAAPLNAPSPSATKAFYTFPPSHTGTGRQYLLPRPIGQSSSGTTRYVGVHIYRAPAPVKPVLPKNAHSAPSGSSKAIGAALAALFFGGFAALRRWLFGGRKKEPSAAAEPASEPTNRP